MYGQVNLISNIIYKIKSLLYKMYYLLILIKYFKTVYITRCLSTTNYSRRPDNFKGRTLYIHGVQTKMCTPNNNKELSLNLN